MLLLLLACGNDSKNGDSRGDDDTGTSDDSNPTDDSAPPDDSVPNDDSADDSGKTDDSGTQPATSSIYVSSDNALYTWSVENGAELIGYFVDAEAGSSVSGVDDIAMDAEGVLYVAWLADLYRVDAADATCTWVMRMSDPGTGLAFLPDGRLLTADYGLNGIDLTTSKTESLGFGGSQTSGDVVVAPDGTVYWTLNTTDSDTWAHADLAKGTLDVVGDIGATEVWGIAYAEDVMYGFGDNGDVYEIDVATGVGTLVTTEAVDFTGATSPVAF